LFDEFVHRAITDGNGSIRFTSDHFECVNVTTGGSLIVAWGGKAW
jgi:hypothetical protein